jgi:hypothetical protein
MRFKLMPGSQVDVHSFELKTESGCTVQAVHEALAQTRFTHFGHLVWHLPKNSKAEARLAEIEKHCDEHGVGLIRMRDPSAADAYEILLDPIRKRTLPSVVEGFLEARLSASQRQQLAANPRVFADVILDAAKHARTLVTKQLKAKGSDLSTLRNVNKALGRESFTLIVDGMSDAEVKSLVGKFDKHHPELKSSNPAWRRAHLRALADGKMEPATKPQSTAKPKPRNR